MISATTEAVARTTAVVITASQATTATETTGLKKQHRSFSVGCSEHKLTKQICQDSRGDNTYVGWMQKIALGKEGERGLASIQDSVDASIQRLEDYISAEVD